LTLRDVLHRWLKARRLRLNAGGRLDGFAAWQIFNAPSARSRRIVDELAKQVPHDCYFSIVIPVSSLEELEETLGSIAAQTYTHFELLLVEDASTPPDLHQALQDWERRDSRVRRIPNPRSGSRSAATNLAAESAKGDYLVLLEEAGRLHQDALLLFADHISRHPDADIVYSDDATREPGSLGLKDPRFKPDWSPELLLSCCYVPPLLVLRTSLYRQVGGCRLEFEGAHIHDLLLRASENGRGVGHIPQLLLHRRLRSTEATSRIGRLSAEAGRKAVEQAWQRRGLPCRVAPPEWAADFGAAVHVPQMPDEGPTVALVIPTRNNWRILDRLVQSLKATTYKNYKICVIDNMSDEAETVAYLNALEDQVIRIANQGGRFSYAYINNRAVEQVDAEFVLFLNDDTSVIDPAWLSQMVGWARLPGVGAVGARLLFPDGRVQHGGVVLGLRKGLTAFRGLPGSDPGYLGFAKVTRTCSAVTAAAMLTPRALFLKLGGFDETAFAVSYNDVDYCLRLSDAGYRVVYCGEAELHHHQGYTRGPGSTSPLDVEALVERHGHRTDPYYSPHLSLDGHQFAIKPRVVPPLPLDRPLRIVFCTEALGEDGAGESLFDLVSGLKREGTIEPVVVSLKDGSMRGSYERDDIEDRVLAATPLQTLRKLRDYELWLAKVRAEIDFEVFDVVCADNASTFWAIDAAQRSGVPSIWIIRETVTPNRYFHDLPAEIAAIARGCFGFPYRVMFGSSSGRKGWAELDRLDNYDLIEDGPDPSKATLSTYAVILTDAAFSAVPPRASRARLRH
jgi:GT2 family glycosyltransferase